MPTDIIKDIIQLIKVLKVGDCYSVSEVENLKVVNSCVQNNK